MLILAPPLPLLDFDPAKIPRRKLKDKNQQQIIRLMAPFSMRCNSCGEYIYKGKKFNARKETALGEDYMGIKARSPLSRPMWTRDAQWLAELTVLPFTTVPCLRPLPDLPLLHQVHALLDRNHVQDGPKERRLHLRAGRVAQL